MVFQSQICEIIQCCLCTKHSLTGFLFPSRVASKGSLPARQGLSIGLHLRPIHWILTSIWDIEPSLGPHRDLKVWGWAEWLWGLVVDSDGNWKSELQGPGHLQPPESEPKREIKDRGAPLHKALLATL